ncbi:MAG: conserved phage C-terminal domain-containing protein [Dialister invisus]|uniref:conserved phage C-terminal domain-containing protein n=1 Tax=Dialister invisus TaxID=218538 RepID=UPI00399A12C7
MKNEKHYKANTPKTVRLIRARLKEGFTVEDFKAVIEKKCDDWLGNEKMERYSATGNTIRHKV